ncbi:MAG: methylmalonyl Co-A mutase-associated GTPase MeaB [Phaeodactylibacter sp.]|nr:methylmalonyl Co-A mutase-associated GTPase MeaB [Phaeodactylibacter sp.]MCB9296115.1 methylmalonyl Co-A mutase-associated GTPase MeaB [Lewinellaceae bacterium]
MPKRTKPQVRSGVPQPGSLNPHLQAQRRKLRPAAEYVAGILGGSRVLLGQAITLIESTRPEHQELAQAIIEGCLPHSGRSFRVGITGSPGAGKSTFIEALGQHLLQQGGRLAVLAIDPSSQVSRGSILGDKTRMEKLASREAAFIRPSPAGESLGGVARKTRESIILCEAAGYDTIFIETVGVGQSETAVHSMADFFLLLLLPGAGDELQGIKRGIVEMADLIAVNKADGERLPLAKRARQEYRNALHLLPPKVSGWAPRVEICSATTGTGIAEAWAVAEDYLKITKANGFFEKNRRAQAHYWLHEAINQQLRAAFAGNADVREKLKSIEQAVLEGKLSPFQGAEELVGLFLKG